MATSKLRGESINVVRNILADIVAQKAPTILSEYTPVIPDDLQDNTLSFKDKDGNMSKKSLMALQVASRYDSIV